MNTIKLFFAIALLLLVVHLPSFAQKRVQVEREVQNFTMINIGGAFNVFLTQGNSHSVVVEAPEDLMDMVITEVRGKELKVYNRRNINNSGRIHVYIEFRELEELDISGASNVEGETLIKAETLDLKVSGAGNTYLDLEVDRLTTDVSGAGNVELNGKAGSHNLKISGAGNFVAYGFKCDKLSIEANGAAHAKVYAVNEIEAYAKGASSIIYKGNPEKVMVNSSGAGDIRQAY
ncbi:MAG: DUF2807 domain-containing protein [Bacteroidetes bacterium]|nr:DUF2807 domain-containing protein [Bacteroidota bacterium]